jgi:acetylornithine deacetylase/succinyl-diaminopimelate desuccinylase-like protein
MANLEHLPLVTPEDDPLVGAVRVACESVKGSPEPGESFPAWSDGALLSNFAGIPCVVLGPGDLAVAHSPHEHVPLAQVAEAARLYAASALAFCPAGV